LTKIDPDNVIVDQIHIARKFDDKIKVFKELNVQAKILKDMRTQELRRLKENHKELVEDEMTEMIMKDD